MTYRRTHRQVNAWLSTDHHAALVALAAAAGVPVSRYAAGLLCEGLDSVHPAALHCPVPGPDRSGATNPNPTTP
jgi:hypothetical protein